MKRIILICHLMMGLSAGLYAQGIETPASALAGTSSGLRISGTDGSLSGAYSAVIRGLNSLRGNSAPLLVVDGVIIDNPIPGDGQAFWQQEYEGQTYTPSLNMLGYFSAADIESIEVLKDLSATAIYGSRGANGVIVIKTRSTKENEPSLEWQSKGGIYAPGGYMHNHYFIANGSKSGNQFTASGFYRQENDGYTPMDNHSGGARIMFSTSPGAGVVFGLNTTFGAQRQSALNTAAFYGSGSMGVDMALGKDISSWKNDFDDYAVAYHVANNAYMDVNLLRSLRWHTQITVDYQNSKRFTFYGEQTDFGKDLKSAAAVQSSSALGYLASTELHFNKLIAVHHNLRLRSSAEVSGNRAIYNNMNGIRLVAPHLRAKGLNLVSEFSTLHTFKPSYLHVAAYGLLMYSYKDIAGVKATVRADNTPEYDDARFVIYPSAEGYIDVRRLAMPKHEFISTLKLSAGWGVAGRENIVMYPLLESYVTGYYPQLPYDAQPVMNGLNRDISREYNVGLSFGILKDRVYGQVKYYDKSTVSTLNIYNFASVNTNTQMWEYDSRKMLQSNVDGILNRGVEVDLRFVPVLTDDIRWEVTALAALQSNQVSGICKDDIFGASVGKGGLVANVNAIGHSIGSIYGYDVNEAGDIVDHTGDGLIAPEDRIILGRTQPKIFGTVGTSLKLWDFGFSALLDGAAGHDLLNMTAMARDEAEFISAEYVERADFLRLSKVSMNYNIPVRIKGIRAVEISLSGHNLLCLTKYSGVNPDVDSFGTSNFTRGIDMGALPMYKAVVLGVDVKF